MGKLDWPLLAGVALTGLAAAGAAIAWREAPSMAAALLALAGGQMFLAMLFAHRHSSLEERLDKQGRGLRGLAQDMESQKGRVGELESSLPDEAEDRVGTVASEVRALRDSFQEMTARMNRERRRAEPAPAPKAQAEELEVLLEPVVEISTNATAHYRAQLRMANGAAGEVGHDALMTKAEQTGMRASLDFVLLKRCLPALRLMRAKHPSRRIFVPLGSDTITVKEDLDRLVSAIEGAADVAPGLVVVIAHAQLASFGAAGIEGLARLSRLGITMALANVTIAGLDLASLKQLGVRYLEVDSGAMDVGQGVAPSWLEFASFARAMQFQLVAGGVAGEQHAAAAAKVARFARGPYYASPRRLRGSPAESLVYGQSQAA